MAGINLSQHYFLDVASDLSEIMNPILSRYNISFFRYFRLNSDGSRVNLCNNRNWTNHFYNEGFYKVAWYDRYQPSVHQSGKFVWDEKSLTSDNIVGIQARTIFDINHGFSVVRSHKTHCEVFDFATTKDNVFVNELYLRHPDLFDNIIFYFKSEARDLILNADKSIISLPMDVILKEKYVSSNLHELNISKYFIDTDNGETYLTKKEYDCLSLWACGKTAKQIGLILGLSFRTVETHLENIKGKFNINNKDQLFNQLQLSGLFETLVKNGVVVYQEFKHYAKE